MYFASDIFSGQDSAKDEEEGSNGNLEKEIRVKMTLFEAIYRSMLPIMLKSRLASNMNRNIHEAGKVLENATRYLKSMPT